MSGLSFLDLLDSSIRDSNKAAVDFSSLYRFLHALLTHLGIQDLVLRSGLLQDEAGRAVTTAEPGEEPPLAQQSLLNRVQRCEDELTRVTALFRDLQQHRNQEQTMEVKETQEQMKQMKEIQEQMKEVKEIQEQMKEVKEIQEQMKEVKETQEQTAVKELQEQMKEVRELQEQIKEVNGLHEQIKAVNDLHEKIKEVKEHQEQTKELQEPMTAVMVLQKQMKETCVTWDVLHASLLAGQQVSPDTRDADASLRHFSPEPSGSCESMRVKEDTTGPRESASCLVGEPYGSSLSEQHQQTLEALRDIGGLRNQRLDQRVALLEEGKMDQAQLTPLHQLINRGSLEVKQLMKDVEQQRTLMDDLRKQQKVLNQSLQDLEATSKCVMEPDIKVDQMVLDSKVSRRDFDSVTEQLNAMFNELLNRVSGQEQNWQQLMERLSSEMDCKLNRLELDSVKKQLEDRWKKIQSKLQTQEEPENQDAAGLRKQLIDRFHCLSCDRPITKLGPGPRLVTLPSSPGLPSHRSIRPFTVYALEQFRHHYRSDGVSAATDHQLTSRRGGRSQTAVAGLQRRTKQAKQQADMDLQSEEVDIVGLDGQVYRGRLNAPPFGNQDRKLPNISGKDVSSKSEDKSRNSTHRSPPSPESRGGEVTPTDVPADSHLSLTGSCGSGRARSVLGCPSQSSILETPAADLLDPMAFQM
ncbi:glutamine-rich protein 2 isoform X2 [Synchiropus splendidus]|uniref:glutamine-rich protein 2 isoform X2 n=1 Tax=Synchiropus splendidus TaxID=270530 RepID=UPI00237E1B29|nr:glutamine-rich protein 2 isoform X2 [Synchiropus splendidus]